MDHYRASEYGTTTSLLFKWFYYFKPIQCYSDPMLFSLNVFDHLVFLVINSVDFVFVGASIFRRLDLMFGMIQLQGFLLLLLMLLSMLQSKVLRKVVLNSWDDSLNKLQEDNEVHVHAQLTTTFHNLKKLQKKDTVMI